MDNALSTDRLEAFSDEVFASAITLLILDVGVKEDSGSLAHRLAVQWPSYAAFLVSFGVIGIAWVNHHQMLYHIRTADHGLTVANLALLLVVTVIPFPTKIVASAFQTGTFADRRTAALHYGLAFDATIIAFNVLWLWAAFRRRLIDPASPQARIDARTHRSLLGIPTFALATLAALRSPTASLALDGLLR